MQELQVGDRVETRPEIIDQLSQGAYTAVVTKRVGQLIYVQREDGITDAHGEWKTLASYLRVIEPATSVAQPTAEQHIAGLSPEQIDWQAHRAFLNESR